MRASAEGIGPVAPSDRYRGILSALLGAAFGFAFGEAMAGAKTSDAFLVVPDMARIATYAAGLLLLTGLTIALELGGPPLVARGGRAARQVRAAIWRRCRHGRSRAEIAKVEAGLTVSFCLVLAGLGLVFATPKAVLVVVIVAALVFTVKALLTLCRLASYAPLRCAALGILYGLGAGYLV